MSDSTPPEKSALKDPYKSKTLHRSNRFAQRRLINPKGQAIQPTRSIHFQTTANVRPFNSRNTAADSANASGNSSLPLINGKNARGYAPRIRAGDPRLDPAFAEEMGTNTQALRNTMVRSKQEVGMGINRPTLKNVRRANLNKSRHLAKKMYVGATQHEMGYPNPHLNKLWFQGANDEYLNQERQKMKRLYLKHGKENAYAAIRAAQIDKFKAQQIAAQQIAANNSTTVGGKSRRSRKTRRNRK